MRNTPTFRLQARTTAEPEPDLTPMVVIHRAIRQDLRRLPACIVALDGGRLPGRPAAICRYAATLLKQIRAHHEAEDEFLWPMIAAAAGQSVDLVPLADDHQAIDAAIGKAEAVLTSLGAEAGEFGELHASVTALRDMVDESIADEEAQVFPAMRRYLTAGAYRWSERQAWRKASWPDHAFRVPWLARYARPDELTRILAPGGWPARILLATTRSRYAALERQTFGEQTHEK